MYLLSNKYNKKKDMFIEFYYLKSSKYCIRGPSVAQKLKQKQYKKNPNFDSFFLHL